MNTKSKVILGILGAAAAGVVIGMLVAPEKGKDSRKKIKKTAGEWADKLSHLWHKTKEAAENAGKDMNEKTRYAEEKIKESLS